MPIAELEIFVRKNIFVDIILLNETFLKSNHKFYKNWFKVYRGDRISHGGGILIAVRDCIRYKILDPDGTSLTVNLSISLDLNGRSITIGSAYAPKYFDQLNMNLTS